MNMNHWDNIIFIQETTLPVEQIELLVMKALSQGLVKGRIDEVSQKYFSPEENIVKPKA